jgi:hypothetical protein
MTDAVDPSEWKKNLVKESKFIVTNSSNQVLMHHNGPLESVKEEIKRLGMDKSYNPAHIWSRPAESEPLTRTAIEELGWKHTGTAIDIWFKKEGTIERHNWRAQGAALHYNFEDHWLFIHVMDLNQEHPVFEGVCETIEEFKQILNFVRV